MNIESRVGYIFLFSTLALAGCSPGSQRLLTPHHDVTAAHLVGPVAWHAKQERSCLASGQIRQSRFIRPRASLGSPAGCGAERPFIVSAALDGRVVFQPAATLRCPMISPVEDWLQNVVQPAAQRNLGSRVVSLKVAASYACRSRNNKAGAKLSEHGRANALDVSAFHLSDGSTVSVKQHWSGFNQQARFLRAVHRGGCRYFSTVLGPNADSHHHDHFHFDLARHGRQGTYKVCR